MLNREAAKNRINGLIKEYDSDGVSQNLSEAMAEILKAIQLHDMRKLTWEQLEEFDGIPVWVETTDEWIKNSYIKPIKGWKLLEFWDGIPELDAQGYILDKSNYGKLWNCYERIL